MSRIVKTMDAGGAIAHRRFVKFSADYTVVQASAATDAIIGVSDCPGGVASGSRVDVVLFGFAELEYGAAVTRGALLTSDASGKAIAAAPATGANVATGGRAPVTTAAGDQIQTLFLSGQIQG